MLLLDTCVLLWLAADQERLSAVARAAIAAQPTELFVSAISAFEISLKHRKGKLDLGMEPELWWRRAIAHHGLRVLPVSDEIAMASTALPALHADPCDRMIIATSTAHGGQIITSDPLIRQYPGAKVVW